MRRDWAGFQTDRDIAYAMVDHKEFFAEISVTYWSRNNYSELSEIALDREALTMEQCSPPILEPNVLARLSSSLDCRTKYQALTQRISVRRSREFLEDAFGPLMRFLKSFHAIFHEDKLPHCNKFYPFTCGQLRNHDPTVYAVVDSLWEEIAKWEDPLLGTKFDVSTSTCCDKFKINCRAPFQRKRNAIGLLSDKIEL